MSPRKRHTDGTIATPKQVGLRLRSRRIALALSRTQVADRIGVRPQQVQKYEYGIHQMNATMIQKMARALDVTPNYFFERS